MRPRRGEKPWPGLVAPRASRPDTIRDDGPSSTMSNTRSPSSAIVSSASPAKSAGASSATTRSSASRSRACSPAATCCSKAFPGVGKTSLVHTLADVLHLKFSRIQFTPDLMPADIVGTNIVQEHAHGGTFFEFQPGPIFANMVLADEINRATPKTQSALLEAMQDVSVSVGTTTYPLEQPFLVLATQNPLEMEGTYPLPEAQLDRFFFKLKVTYPTEERDARDPRSHDARRGRRRSARVVDGPEILEMRQVAERSRLRGRCRPTRSA